MSVSAKAAPVLTFNGTEVTGATGFESPGFVYTMVFADGTCSALFNGCNEASDFDVGTTTQSALSLLFFNEFIAPNLSANDKSLDAIPSLAVGCFSSGNRCLSFVPFEITAGGTFRADLLDNWYFNSENDKFSPAATGPISATGYNSGSTGSHLTRNFIVQ